MHLSLVNVLRSPAFKPLRQLVNYPLSRWPYPVPVNLKSEGKIFVDLRSSIGRSILGKGTFEPLVYKALKEHIAEGSVFIDIGCNIGYYSLLASGAVGKTGEVHCFEADQRPLKCFRKTLKHNRINNVYIHPYALSEHPEILSFDSKTDCGLSAIGKNSGVTRNSVPALPLDCWNSYFTDKRISVIKIDIEGYELFALKGARTIIERHHPVIVCEANENSRRFGYERAEMFTFLEELGYDHHTITGADDNDTIFLPDDKHKRSCAI